MSRKRSREATALIPAASQDAAAGGEQDGRFVTCPFTVIVDSREQKPYTFEGLRANADQGRRPIRVPTMRAALPLGDYSLFGCPGVAIERKSKEDLYQSISQNRANFEGRLRRLSSSEYHYAAIVVESELHDLTTNPPAFTQFSPKSLNRTIQAWTIRYPFVHWWFLWGRDAAESYTFRLLERFWVAYHRGELQRDDHRRDIAAGVLGEIPVVGIAEVFGDDGGQCPQCNSREAVTKTGSGWMCETCGVGW